MKYSLDRTKIVRR